MNRHNSNITNKNRGVSPCPAQSRDLR